MQYKKIHLILIMVLLCAAPALSWNIKKKNKAPEVPTTTAVDSVKTESTTQPEDTELLEIEKEETDSIQQETTVQNPTEEVEEISIESLQERISNLENELNNKTEKCDSLDGKVKNHETTISVLSNQINTLNQQIKDKDTEIEKLKGGIDKSDHYLVDIASNFLYIPYEKYSIDEVAIPAFDAVSNLDLKKKYNNRYVLLKKYTEHAKQLRKFLQKADAEFAKSPMLRPDSNTILKELKSLDIYTDYTAYDDWKETYLGKFLNQTMQTINKIGNSQQTNVFKDLIKQLDDLNIK